MVHELDFADVQGLIDAYELVAQIGGVQSCEIDLDRVQITFVTRFPLPDLVRGALEEIGGLLRVRCWPAPVPVFAFAEAAAAAAASAAGEAPPGAV